jgi:hypothetical protein
MATVVRREVRKRGFFGKVFLGIFWIWNALMAFGLISGLVNVGNSGMGTTEAERAGAAIGTALGVGMILWVWVLGAAILGLLVFFSRGQKTIIETTES